MKAYAVHEAAAIRAGVSRTYRSDSEIDLKSGLVNMRHLVETAELGSDISLLVIEEHYGRDCAGVESYPRPHESRREAEKMADPGGPETAVKKTSLPFICLIVKRESALEPFGPKTPLTFCVPLYPW